MFTILWAALYLLYNISLSVKWFKNCDGSVLVANKYKHENIYENSKFITSTIEFEMELLWNGRGIKSKSNTFIIISHELKLLAIKEEFETQETQNY